MEIPIDSIQYAEPASVVFQQDSGKNIKLGQAKISEKFDHFFLDLPDSDQIKMYRYTDPKNGISFHYGVHSGMKTIIAPPNGIKMDDEYRKTGIGNQIQIYLETVAKTYGYRLMAGLTLQSAAAFNQRVIHILRGYGYHIGPPTEEAEIHLCIHDINYNGNGIPEVSGMEKEFFIPPIKSLI